MHKNIYRDSTAGQAGFVSIVVSMIIMTVLTLITIGFSQIMAREQRQALDRQLSTQAFYAAESGVNDVDLAIKRGTASSFSTDCSPPRDVSTDGSVRNTCITYDDVVEDIVFQAVPPNPFEPRVFPLRAATGTTASISINFAPTNIIESIPRFRPNTTTSLPPAGTSSAEWNASTGIIKVYLIPFRDGMSRQQLIDATAYYTLYPQADSSGTTSIDYSTGLGAGYGDIFPVNCTDVGGCDLRINGIDGITYTDLYMVINTVYQPNDVTIDAVDTTGNSQRFRDVQAIVDSTGRTTDVLRRIQVRLPIGDTITSAFGALIATDPTSGICKLIETSENRTVPVSPCSL